MTEQTDIVQGEAPVPVSDSPESTNGATAMDVVDKYTESPKAENHRLTAEAIIAAKDLKEEEIDVPEWGGTILIRSFTKKQQQLIRTMATVDDEVDGERLEMFMFIHAVIEPRFTDDQFEQLREKSAGVLDRVLSRVMSLSGMDEAAQRAADRQFPTTS